ncbi:DUF397 domain-containing protein [Streptomyces halstedii]|uniref:DUF397 domain-containing protein n=1 Tax=Streptomyces halstedii TaxID=1944 RepID=A0ABS6TTV6_STRHA|nr:DUF397 domain-containing protein [Streptomyces halstedii]MBV7671716.1 DUF397 domain-containing protein [Streptomyces halstedii]
MSITNLVWFKSSYSGSSGDSCIEVATAPGTVHVRDSKVEKGPRLTLSSTSWAPFVSYAALG